MRRSSLHAGPRSLTGRLLLASLIGLPIYLAFAGWFLHQSFATSQLAAANERLRAQFYGLLSAIELDDRGLRVTRTVDPRLGQADSGYYALVHRPDGSLLWHSASAESLPLPVRQLTGLPELAAGSERFELLELHKNGAPDLFRFQYQLLWERNHAPDEPLVVTLLESADALVAETAAFRGQLWLGLGGAALLLTVAQAAILKWGLRPLHELTDHVRELERGQRGALTAQYPAELELLAANLNQLLERERRQRERYRNTLGDLAHSLKTPLAVLQQESEAEHPQPGLIREQVARMDDLVRYQLQRAVQIHSRQLGPATPLRPIADKLAGTFAKVYHDKRIQFSVEVEPASSCRGDEADLYEVLGNLLDNACKACDFRVGISTAHTEQWELISVEDDGPGILDADRERILGRGERADSSQPGQGIGLAVVLDVLDSYGAELDIERSRWRGARFTVRWPRTG